MAETVGYFTRAILSDVDIGQYSKDLYGLNGDVSKHKHQNKDGASNKDDDEGGDEKEHQCEICHKDSRTPNEEMDEYINTLKPIVSKSEDYQQLCKYSTNSNIYIYIYSSSIVIIIIYAIMQKMHGVIDRCMSLLELINSKQT